MFIAFECKMHVHRQIKMRCIIKISSSNLILNASIIFELQLKENETCTFCRSLFVQYMRSCLLYNVSSSGGNAIFLSWANFLSAAYFARMISTSSRILMLSSFINSMSFHSYKKQLITWSRFKIFSHIYYLWFLVLQLVFLFNSLDSAGCSISTIFQCSSPLLHTNDLISIQSSHFKCSIQVPHRYWHQLIIVDFRKRAWR